MYLTCECGERRHIHKNYLPDRGETTPIVCVRCDKEWELYGARTEVQLREVNKPDPRAIRRKEV